MMIEALTLTDHQTLQRYDRQNCQHGHHNSHLVNHGHQHELYPLLAERPSDSNGCFCN